MMVGAMSSVRIKTPLFPLYSQVQSLLRTLDGVPVSLFTDMVKSIWAQRGTPQQNVDWTVPEAWIPQRLFGSEAELALHIWIASDQLVNPRHLRGSQYFMRNHGLLTELSESLRPTDRGTAFVAGNDGIIREIDEIEVYHSTSNASADDCNSRRTIP